MNKTILLLLLPLFVIACSPQKVEWPEATQSSKPWTRWWWMNNAVDKENLSRELSEFAEMGIGGVEITPIYGVKGEESRDIEFLSPAFTKILDFTIDEANKLGLGVDLPAGSGWRNGGPFVPREKGLWNLKLRKVGVKKGETVDLALLFENEAAASFLGKDGVSEIIDLSTPFLAKSNGTIYVAIRVNSSNKVKRPAKGGEGWAIDTFNEEITNWYLNEFWKRLGIDEGKLRCFFHDSFEYTGDFTTHFLQEFEQRRGYKLARYLYALDKDCSDKTLQARVKSDYRETLSDLVLESFIQPMTEWTNKHNSWNRNQAHGSPGNILDLYAACDIPETEIFQKLNQNSPDVFVNKFASSAAHITGKKLVSSESYTWLNEHWTVTPSELVKATNRFFLAGVNHMFFQGTCYSPTDVEWPGWLFYASTEMNNRNPIWRELPALFKYIERTQSILQESTPQNNLLVYWPYYDVAASEGKIFNHIGVNKDAGWFYAQPISGLSEKLNKNGYTYDYISDKQLQDVSLFENTLKTTGGAAYKAIVIPEAKYIPLQTLKKLQSFQDKGGMVVFDTKLPESVPGLYNLKQREKEFKQVNTQINPELVGNSIEILGNGNVQGETELAENGFFYLKMNNNGEVYYLLVNAGRKTKDAWLSFSEKANEYIFMNPMTGAISKAELKNEKVRIQLKSEEIVFVKCAKAKTDAKRHIYTNPSNNNFTLDGKWKVEFIEGGPELPANVIMKNLRTWTNVGDKKTEKFAGTARYTVEFIWDGNASGNLNLGKVLDCASVRMNNKSYGSLLGPDFSVYVDNLRTGTNKIEVEVTNVAANRIRDLDVNGVGWRKFKDINYVNFDYKPFNAASWKIRDAGLLGPVTITKE